MRRIVLLLVCAVGAPSAAAVPLVKVTVKFGDLRPQPKDPLFKYEPALPTAYVHGELALSVELERGAHNPFCFAYTVEPEVADWTPPPPIPIYDGEQAKAAPTKLSLELADRLKGCVPLLDKFWGACSVAPENAFQAQEKDLAGLVKACSSPELVESAKNWLLSAPAGAEKAAVEALLPALSSAQESAVLAQQLDAGARPFTAHYSTGKSVTLRVKRKQRVRGVVADGAPETVFEGRTFKTLSPISLDVGAGPGLTFTPKADYEYVARATDTGSEWYVARTKNELNLDGVVMFSPYYVARWLDETHFDPIFLIPRPALGLSMTEPLTSFYLGLQLDPYQFIDLTFGYRFFSQTVLIGRAEGDLALLDADGAPLALGKAKRLEGSFFFAITASTDLFVRWITRL